MKMNPKVLLLEGISPTAVELLKQNGIDNIETLSKSLEWQALIEALEWVDYLWIRSRTQVTEEVIGKVNGLLAIGCFCIGTNQVDLDAAMRAGIPVFNAPHSNTRSVAELVLGEIIMLLRKTFPLSNGVHNGEWNKDAKNSFEVRGKTLGIVGYGNIGTQLSVLAENLGMKVIYYDVINKVPMGNALKKDSLQKVLKEADVITLHVPEDETTKNLIDEKALKMMKQGSYIINASRGTVVDIDALKKNLESGKILWAAIDVFPMEPKGKDEKFVSPLQWLPNVILTPHVWGSTEEAQTNIGREVADKFISFHRLGSTAWAVNFPQPGIWAIKEGCQRIQFIHENIPGMMAAINSKFWDNNIQIFSQSLDTKWSLWYATLDVQNITPEIMAELERMRWAVKVRLLW